MATQKQQRKSKSLRIQTLQLKMIKILERSAITETEIEAVALLVMKLGRNQQALEASHAPLAETDLGQPIDILVSGHHQEEGLVLHRGHDTEDKEEATEGVHQDIEDTAPLEHRLEDGLQLGDAHLNAPDLNHSALCLKLEHWLMLGIDLLVHLLLLRKLVLTGG